MECRAKHAEDESRLLKDQMEQLRKQLNEVMGFLVLIFYEIVVLVLMFLIPVSWLFFFFFF